METRPEMFKRLNGRRRSSVHALGQPHHAPLRSILGRPYSASCMFVMRPRRCKRRTRPTQPGVAPWPASAHYTRCRPRQGVRSEAGRAWRAGRSNAKPRAVAGLLCEDRRPRPV